MDFIVGARSTITPLKRSPTALMDVANEINSIVTEQV